MLRSYHTTIVPCLPTTDTSFGQLQVVVPFSQHKDAQGLACPSSLFNSGDQSVPKRLAPAFAPLLYSSLRSYFPACIPSGLQRENPHLSCTVLPAILLRGAVHSGNPSGCSGLPGNRILGDCLLTPFCMPSYETRHDLPWPRRLKIGHEIP
jgi:hypothetical protein